MAMAVTVTTGPRLIDRRRRRRQRGRHPRIGRREIGQVLPPRGRQRRRQPALAPQLEGHGGGDEGAEEEAEEEDGPPFQAILLVGG